MKVAALVLFLGVAFVLLTLAILLPTRPCVESHKERRLQNLLVGKVQIPQLREVTICDRRG